MRGREWGGRWAKFGESLERIAGRRADLAPAGGKLSGREGIKSTEQNGEHMPQQLTCSHDRGSLGLVPSLSGTKTSFPGGRFIDARVRKDHRV